VKDKKYRKKKTRGKASASKVRSETSFFKEKTEKLYIYIEREAIN